MPLYDFECGSCGQRTEHYFGRLRDAVPSLFNCPVEGCDGIQTKAAVDGTPAVYHPSIEMWVERERGHLDTYRPPPATHTKSGAGIRKWPMPNR